MYIKTSWVNRTAPYLEALNLNHMEKGIYDNSNAIDAIGLGETAKGEWTPTTGTEYPSSPTLGDSYFIAGLSTPYTFAGGDLTGKETDNQDKIYYSDAGWILVEQNNQPTDIVKYVDAIDDLSGVDINTYTVVIVKEDGRGGTFIYDASRSGENDGGTVFDGWVRQYVGEVHPEWFSSTVDFDAFVLSTNTTPYTRKLLGVIRNNGTGWEFIDNSEHTPVGFDDTIVVTSTYISVVYNQSARKVGTLLIVPDETMAGYGITTGASVGLNNAVIKFYKEADALVDLDTHAFSSLSSYDIDAAQMSITSTAGDPAIVIVHPSSEHGVSANLVSPNASTANIRSSVGKTSLSLRSGSPYSAYVTYSPDIVAHTVSEYEYFTFAETNGVVRATAAFPVSDKFAYSITTTGAGSPGATYRIVDFGDDYVEFTATDKEGVPITDNTLMPTCVFVAHAFFTSIPPTNGVAKLRGKYLLDPSLFETGLYGNFWVYGDVYE